VPSRVAVFSDIHIGNNLNTCWYQPRVHEKALVTALDYVADTADQFAEVILLGDLVDTWTYPPTLTPPSMADIIAANPAVLGSDGALQRVVKAVPKVTYVLGNHDGTITQADISALQSSVGAIEMADPVHVLTGASGKRTVFSHGHYSTMFNAPDDRAPWGDSLPVGHFVTRAFSYMMANQLQPGVTVADLSGFGYPDGFDIWMLVSSFAINPNPDIASVLLNYVADTAHMRKDLQVALPNGHSASIDDAVGIYKDLFTRWEQSEGTQNAARAAMADGSGNYLAWFAQRLAIQQSADLIVMGHTHTPVGGLAVSPISYFNNGFECTPAPDNPTKALWTFTMVDLDTPWAEIFQVSPGDDELSVAGIPAMRTVVQPPGVDDWSCYVRIFNQSQQPLILNGSSASAGTWVVPPPQTIPAGGRGDAWLQDNWGAEGSAGAFSYSGAGDFSVSCPTGSSNAASGAGGNFVTKIGSGEWGDPGKVPSLGRPLQVKFTVGG
jgi:UDP-2,3-diacylglucosamine pyrophosphatase LpxH